MQLCELINPGGAIKVFAVCNNNFQKKIENRCSHNNLYLKLHSMFINISKLKMIDICNK